ncbi:MAG: ABC transporter permease [Lachnospiraceae bacterium]
MKRFFEDIKKYYGYMVRAAKSSLKTEVANSYLNWIWWILDPLFTMLIYYVIFGVVFDGKEPNFPIFLFIGITMWTFFNKNVVQSVNIVKRNKSIVSKVYIPKFILLISNMMINGFKMIISWIIVALMMLVFRVDISWKILWFVPIMLVLIIVTFGVSIHLVHFGVFVEDLSNVINIAFKLLFYMTGIMFNIEKRIHNPLFRDILIYCNPVALLIHDMRNVLLYKTAPCWQGMLIWAAIGILLSAIGIRQIYKNENSYVKVI